MDKTSFFYWWPKVKDLGVPVPRTECVDIGPQFRRDMLANFDGKLDHLPEWDKQVREAAARIGYPLFLRTDLSSGKHGWRDTCFVPDSASLPFHVVQVVEWNELAGVMGLDYRGLVLREYISLEAPFTAFAGLPIARERRYFVRDGKVVCHHPYWPEDAIERPSEEDWRELLAELNEESEAEIMCLSNYAGAIAGVVDGYWSVDFAKAQNGLWYLIDMAVGEESWHPECDENQS
jgi:hypothetical protein